MELLFNDSFVNRLPATINYSLDMTAFNLQVIHNSIHLIVLPTDSRTKRNVRQFLPIWALSNLENRVYCFISAYYLNLDCGSRLRQRLRSARVRSS
jgi:hypothetical protein